MLAVEWILFSAQSINVDIYSGMEIQALQPFQWYLESCAEAAVAVLPATVGCME